MASGGTVPPHTRISPSHSEDSFRTFAIVLGIVTGASGQEPSYFSSPYLLSHHYHSQTDCSKHQSAATELKMTAADMRDMLGDLPIEAHAPRAKKQKVIEKRPGSIHFLAQHYT